QNGDEALQRANAPTNEGMIVVTPKERASKPDAAPAPAAPPTASPAPVLAIPPPPAAATAAAPQAAKALGDDVARSKLEQETLKKRAEEKPSPVSTDEEALSAARDRREE